MTTTPHGAASSAIKRIGRLESLAATGAAALSPGAPGMVLALWAGKSLIFCVIALFGGAMAAVALYLPNQYIAEAVLMPTAELNGTSLTGFGGQIGGFASLAGIGVGAGAGHDKSQVAIQLLQSWGFLEKFIRDSNLEVEVFAARGWDRASNTLILDPKLYDPTRREWIQTSPREHSAVGPTGWQLYDALHNRIDVSQDKLTGLIFLRVRHYSPAVAKLLVDGLVRAVNSYIREDDKLEATKKIEYLHRQIEQTSLTDMQKVLYTLIEEHTKTLMLTEVRDEYILKTVSAAQVPERKARPARALLCLLGALCGFLLGSFLWLCLLNAKQAHLKSLDGRPLLPT